MFASTIALALLPVLALVDSTSAQKAASPWRHTRRGGAYVHRNVPRATSWKLQDKYQGSSFLDGFDFFTEADPTHGLVTYVDRQTALNNQLAFTQADNTTVLRVDDQTQLASGQYRNSVRIQSKKSYNNGLFIADFYSLPHGCSAWPAYWMVGPNWPAGGEIDIVEATHNSDHNQAALHTSAGCTLVETPAPLVTTASVDRSKPFTGQIFNTKCASGPSDNSGCGFIDPDTRTFGENFNRAAGGVFATQWTSQGIAMFFFARSEVPADILAGQPDPSTWHTPYAFWSSAGCDMASHFYENKIVLNIALCGDYAGATYANSGCPATCADAVADPSNFKYAKFAINHISVYTQA